MIKKLFCGASLFTLLLSAGLQAQTSLATAIEQCRTEQNALKRLVCYDEIVTPNMPVTAAPAVPTTQTEVKAAQPTTSKDFGLEHKKTVDTAETISAIVSNIRFSPRKDLIIEFDNGQIWRQADSGSYPIKVGERHFIKRGIFGAFYLGNENNNRTLKVKREN